ncbi:MAG: SRPBCC family protein [Sciscionella sp.]
MRLEHTFTVPAAVDVVWAALLDPERVAPCMPGATVQSVEDKNFRGSVKVKLGPVSLLYKGSGEFLETDESAHRVVIKASGKDSRGNGTAAATVTVTLSEEGEQTSGTVETDLNITGKPAQFGRGMITEVGGKILNSFADCLASKLGTDSSGSPDTASGDAAAQGSGTASGAGTSGAAGAGSAAGSAGASTAVGSAAGAGDPGPRHQADEGARQRSSAPSESGAGSAGAGAKGTTGRIRAAPSTPTPRDTASDTAAPIDLLDYAGSSIVKRVLPLLGAAAAVIAAVLLVRRKRSSR